MGFAVCLRLCFSGFRVRSTAVFQAGCVGSAYGLRPCSWITPAKRPLLPPLRRAAQPAFHESGKDAGMFPQEGIFYAVFLHRGVSARYDCHRPWSRSGRMGRDQPAGRLRQRQPCDTFVSEKLTHKVEGHVAQNFGELIFRWVK